MIWLILGLCIAFSLQCGSYTHNHIAIRALDSYLPQNSLMRDIVTKHKDALGAGAAYPDFLYLCGDNHDNGELAHWPPFYDAYIELIQEKYPQPWTEDHEKRVAFFMGVVSHGIADINWHGLAQRKNLGFLVTLGLEDFNCDGTLCNTAHKFGDTGGDFMAEQLLSHNLYSDIKEWYIPTNDLELVYEKLGAKINPLDVSNCGLIFFSEGWLISNKGSGGSLILDTRSQFLSEDYIDFYIGGLDDMATMTTYYWQAIEKQLFGPPKLKPAKKDFIQMVQKLLQKKSKKQIEWNLLLKALFEVVYEHNSPFKLKNLDNGSIVIHYTDQENTAVYNLADFIGTLISIISKLQRHEEVPMHTIQRAMLDLEKAGKDIGHGFQHIYQYLRSLLPWNDVEFQPFSELSIENHSYEQKDQTKAQENTSKEQKKTGFLEHVRPSLDNKQPNLLEVNDDEEIIGQYAQFGQSILLTKEKDYIAAPNYSEMGLPQIGQIQVRDKNSEILDTIKGEQFDIRCGLAMLTMDFNLDGVDDFVYSCPGTGKIDMEEITNNYEGKVVISFGNNKGTFIIRGQPMTYSGVTLNKIFVQDQWKLLIATPFYHGTHQFGAVYLVEPSLQEGEIVLGEPILVGEEYSHFGQTMMVQDQYLFVSAPNLRDKDKNALGKIYAYEFINNTFEQIAEWSTTLNDSQPGAALASYTFQNELYLVLGMPAYGRKSKKRSGEVRIIKFEKGSHNIQENNVQILKGDTPLQQFGQKIKILDNFMFISAPFGEELKGGLFIYKMNEKGHWDLYQIMQGVQQKAIFGYSFDVEKTKDGFRLLVGAPRYDVAGLYDNGKIYEYLMYNFEFRKEKQ